MQYAGAIDGPDPQRLFAIVIIVVVVVLIVRVADRWFVVIVVAGPAGHDETGVARIALVHALPYSGGMRSTWPG